MKKILTFVLALAMGLSLTACGGGDNPDTQGNGDDTQGNSDVQANNDENPAGGDENQDMNFTTVTPGTLTMSTNAAFPPYEMTDDAGNVIGIDAEIGQAIAEKLNLNLVIDNVDFDAALMAVQENRSDIMLAGLTNTKERDLVVDFSDSYATGYQVIIVKEGDKTIAGTNPDTLQLIDAEGNPLDDIQIGVQRGTTGEKYCQEAHGVEHVTSLDNGSVAIQALMNGQVDCVVIDKAPAEEYVKANPGLEILEAEYIIEDYCAAVDEGNTALLNAVNTALNELIVDGTVRQIIDKYIVS